MVGFELGQLFIGSKIREPAVPVREEFIGYFADRLALFECLGASYPIQGLWISRKRTAVLVIGIEQAPVSCVMDEVEMGGFRPIVR
jgi:hypothetical protein